MFYSGSVFNFAWTRITFQGILILLSLRRKALQHHIFSSTRFSLFISGVVKWRQDFHKHVMKTRGILTNYKNYMEEITLDMLPERLVDHKIPVETETVFHDPSLSPTTATENNISVSTLKHEFPVKTEENSRDHHVTATGNDNSGSTPEPGSSVKVEPTFHDNPIIAPNNNSFSTSEPGIPVKAEPS